MTFSATGSVSIGNKDGQLQDMSSNNTGAYTASFDGKNVSLTNSSGTTQNGSWLQGTDAVSGIKGGGNLSEKFSFTFSDHGRGNQRLNARWTFAGSVQDAIQAWEKAGYAQSFLDARFSNEHQPPPGGSLVHMRSPGNFFTGGDSGHAIIPVPPNATIPTSGDVHVGEHNPTTNFPVGFLLHQGEIPRMRSRTLGIVGLTASLLCWLSVFSRWSIFFLLPTVSTRREMLTGIALLSIASVMVAAIKDSRWWLFGLLPSVSLFGLLRLH